MMLSDLAKGMQVKVSHVDVEDGTYELPRSPGEVGGRRSIWALRTNYGENGDRGIGNTANDTRPKGDPTYNAVYRH